MGIEYKLRFSTVDPEAVAKELRRLPEVREVSRRGHWFDLEVGLRIKTGRKQPSRLSRAVCTSAIIAEDKVGCASTM